MNKVNSLFEDLLLNLQDVNSEEINELRNDLLKIAKSHNIDIETADIEALRKLISLYTQNVMEDSSAQ